MIARTALRVLAVITGVLGLVVGTASPGYACGLTYAAVDPVDTGCASTAPAVASAVAVLSAFVATAAVVGSAYQGGGEASPSVLTQAIEAMLTQADAEALAGAQNRLAATAASLGMPVDALPFWHAEVFLFQPTARSLDSSLPQFAGRQADFFRQLVLAQFNTSCQVGPQLGQNLALPQARAARAADLARGQATGGLEYSLFKAYLAEGALPAEAKARAAYETRGAMGQIAVLHVPDLVAGGYDTPVTFGLRSVNSSIGSQLRPDRRLGLALRGYAASIPSGYRANPVFRLVLP